MCMCLYVYVCRGEVFVNFSDEQPFAVLPLMSKQHLKYNSSSSSSSKSTSNSNNNNTNGTVPSASESAVSVNGQNVDASSNKLTPSVSLTSAPAPAVILPSLYVHSNLTWLVPIVMKHILSVYSNINTHRKIKTAIDKTGIMVLYSRNASVVAPYHCLLALDSIRRYVQYIYIYT